MAWYQSPYTLLMLAAAIASVLLAVYAWGRQRVPEARPMALLMLACAVWTVGYGIELASPDLGSKLFWAKFQYLGIAFAPELFFIFALRYTGRGRWITRRNLILLSVEPVVTLLLVLTNDSHRLIWTRNLLYFGGGWPVMLNSLGPANWVNIVYSYILNACVTVMLLQLLLRSLHKWKASVLLFAILVPWMASAVYVANITPFVGLDLTPVGFIVVVLALASGISGLRLEDLLSVSRRTIIEHMLDGVVVLDTDGRVVEMNPAAERLCEVTESQAAGRPVVSVWPEWPDEKDVTIGDDGSTSMEMVQIRGNVKVLDVQTSPVVDWRGMVVGSVATIRDVTERKRLQEELSRQYEMASYLADRDPVTDLLNHRAIHLRLEQEVKLSQRTDQPFSLIMMDLDGFKRVNDDHGHPVGDQVLREVALVLSEAVRETDLLGRYGGDEFVAILPATTGAGARGLALRIRDALARHPYITEEKATIPLRMSYGIAAYPEDATHAERLVEVADERLYESKRRGKGTVAAT